MCPYRYHVQARYGLARECIFDTDRRNSRFILPMKPPVGRLDMRLLSNRSRHCLCSNKLNNNIKTANITILNRRNKHLSPFPVATPVEHLEMNLGKLLKEELCEVTRDHQSAMHRRGDLAEVPWVEPNCSSHVARDTHEFGENE